VQYSNDNPFSKDAALGLWRHYIKSIPLFDLHFAYREANFKDYQQYTESPVHLLRSYFIPEEDYPLSQEIIPKKFKCDVVFAGHYENDGRVEMLEAICNAGFRLNLFGGGWERIKYKLKADSPLRSLYPIVPATKQNYRYAICGAKVALCFLSTLNKDTYTRRNFQIPAMKTVMLSQHTEDLVALFKPDIEAVFFKDQKEMLNKLAALIGNNELRISVQNAGYKKVYTAGHDVKSRMSEFIHSVNEYRDSLKKLYSE